MLFTPCGSYLSIIRFARADRFCYRFENLLKPTQLLCVSFAYLSDNDRFLLNVFIKNCDENLLESDYSEVQVLRKNDRVLIEPVFRE